MPANFRLYNTLSKEIENFQPLVPGEIKLYVCGVTVYDHAHVGHGRAMVVFDAFVRYLRYRGWKVRFVRNFTDVDDKINARAKESGGGSGARERARAAAGRAAGGPGGSDALLVQ